MIGDNIVKAINEKRLLSVFYDGGERKIAPCCYGNGSRGQKLLRCWQVSGFSQLLEAGNLALMIMLFAAAS